MRSCASASRHACPTVTEPAAPPVPIRSAATVVLLREPDSRLEVLLTRRSAQLAFMGDLWVFPGGRLEPADLAPDSLARVPSADHAACGSRLHALTGEALDAATALGLYVAGCRETFEECGVLLARRADGSACDTAQIARLQAHRARTATEGATFLDVLRAEDLMLDVSQLVYWAHWITPSFEARRYDTRFFAVEVPAGQEASVDRTETTEHAWVTVDEAFAAYAAGRMKFAPPTLATLQDLRSCHALHGSLARMLAAERARAVPPILPKWFEDGDHVTIVLPWDPQYATVPGEAVRAADAYPSYLTQLPSRRELRHRPGRRP